MNRRDLIRNLALMPLATGWPWLAKTDGGAVVARKNVRDLSEKELADFRHAVAILKARDAKDKTSWFNLAAIHGAPPAVSGAPPSEENFALWNQCHTDHRDTGPVAKRFPTFLIWHRLYIRCLEDMLGAALKDPAFRLPYWDWYAAPALPDAFRRKYVDAQCTEPNSLFHSERGPHKNDGEAVWDPLDHTEFDEMRFDRFQGMLLTEEHARIHGGCGGDMSAKLTAAHDPIFLLHHANVDRLLMVWLMQDRANHLAPAGFNDWTKLNYRFLDPAGVEYAPEIAVAELNSLSPMGYTYEDLALPDVPPPKLISIGQKSISATAEPGTWDQNGILVVKSHLLVGPAATLVLQLGGANLTRVKTQLASPNGEIDLVLERIKKDDSFEGVSTYELFLALPPNIGPSASFDEHYLGSIDFFGMSRCGPAGESCMAQYFPLSEKIRKLSPNRVDLKNIRISFVPVVSPGAKPPAADDVVLRIARLDLRVPPTGPIQ